MCEVTCEVTCADALCCQPLTLTCCLLCCAVLFVGPGLQLLQQEIIDETDLYVDNMQVGHGICVSYHTTTQDMGDGTERHTLLDTLYSMYHCSLSACNQLLCCGC